MSWSGAAAGAITGAQIGSVIPGVGNLVGGIGGGIVGALGGVLATRRTKLEQALEDYYRQQSQGMSVQEAAQEKSIAESKAEAAEAENRALQIKRGGASTSGIASANALQAARLARFARGEDRVKLLEAQAERSRKMRELGMQGLSAIEQQKRMDQEKAIGLLLTSDIGGGDLDPQGSNLTQIMGTAKKEEYK